MTQRLLTLDFPREVLHINTDGGRGFRKMVSTQRDLEKYWRGKSGLGNAYMTVYGYRATKAPNHHRCDYTTPTIRHFVLDYDCKDFKTNQKVPLEIPLSQVREIHAHLLEENILHGVWFSGGGFHVWIRLEKEWIPSTGEEVSRIKQAGRVLLTDWRKTLSMSCSDPAVPFDTSGMIRLPNSYNDKRGCWSIPLSHDEITTLTPQDLVELAQEARSGYIPFGEKGVQMKVKKGGLRSTTTTNIKVEAGRIDGVKILPCLNAAAVSQQNPAHEPRAYLAQYLLHRLRWWFPRASLDEKQTNDIIDKSVDYILGLNWIDKDEHITRKQVTHAAYSYDDHPSCATLYGKGYCVGKCRYWDGSGAIEGEAPRLAD